MYFTNNGNDFGNTSERLSYEIFYDLLTFQVKIAGPLDLYVKAGSDVVLR